MSKQLLADLVIYGGTIHSMDANFPNPEAVAVKGGKIMAVGNEEDICKLAGGDPKRTRKLEDNQTLLPGFIEPHTHAIQFALTRCMYVSCSATKYPTYDDIKELFKRTIIDKTASGQWCIFLGWDPEMIEDLPELNFDFLDKLTKTIPLMVIGQSGHVAWSNRKAFEIAGIPDDIADPKGFVRDPEGKLTGQMLEAPAMFTVLNKAPQPSKESIDVAMEEQWIEYSNAGFTTITDLAYMPKKTIDDLLQKRASLPDCPVRLGLYHFDSGADEASQAKTCCHVVPFMEEEKASSSSTITETEKLWIAGMKIVADGSPHCGTAAINEKYYSNHLTKILGFPPLEDEPDHPGCGKLNYDDEHLEKRVKKYHAEGKQISIHTHGERAIEQALKAYEEAEKDAPDKDLRHRLEHFGLGEEKHIKKAAELNVSISFFVAHLYFYATSYTKYIFGPERTDRWAPLGLALIYNILWTIHQDQPTFPGPPEPFANLMTVVTRTERRTDPDLKTPRTVYGPEYCIKMKEALKGYTINAARQIHREKELGSLTVGKRADLLILNEDPVKVAEVNPFKIVDIRVVDTYLNGRSNSLNKANK